MVDPKTRLDNQQRNRVKFSICKVAIHECGISRDSINYLINCVLEGN